MPKTTSEDLLTVSVRLTPGVVAQVEAIANGQGQSVNRILRRMIEDSLSLMGLPKPITEVLYEDQKALGMSRDDPRDYLIHLLTLRYRDLITAAAGSRRLSKR